MGNINTTAKYLGPKETEIVSRLSYEKKTLITKQELERLFGKEVLVRQIIYQFRKKGILKPITKGVYYYSPLEAGPSGIRINEYLIPPVLFPKDNYYVGFSTMYNYYGFTDQIFQTMYVLNTSVQRERLISGVPFKMIKILAERMFGLVRMKIRDSELIVSDKERTLIDLFYFPDPVGGLKNAFEILKEKLSGIEAKKLIEYALQFGSVSLQKRIGYALEKAGASDKVLKPLLAKVGKTSLVTLYGSKSRKGKINDKWKVIIDAAQ